MMNEQKLIKIWKQTKVPVILRRIGKKERPRARLPFANDNRSWLSKIGKTTPDWEPNKKYWEFPKSWFNKFVNMALERYGELYVIQPYREQEKCAPACMNASGHECQCSCMGANHGLGNDGSWFEVSETFATRWHDKEVACRLMTRKLQ